jgi:hypothetical protein
MLTGAQLRAARALIRWSVEDAANAAKVDWQTIRRAEAADGRINSLSNNLAAIRGAFEANGVRFSEDGRTVCVTIVDVVEAAEASTITLEELSAANDE